MPLEKKKDIEYQLDTSEGLKRSNSQLIIVHYNLKYISSITDICNVLNRTLCMNMSQELFDVRIVQRNFLLRMRL